MYKIAPSILSADFSRLGEQVEEVQKAGIDRIHVDVMDGVFVPNITIGPSVLKSIRSLVKVPLDVHLMITAPERFLESFVAAGAAMLTVHYEACPHLHRVVQMIRSLGAKPGVSLNPATPVDHLSEIIEHVDLVLLMSVNPGFGGQSFIPSSILKIERLHTLISERGLSVEIAVDGGINKETAPRVAAAGANVLVAGSAIFHHKRGIIYAIEELREGLRGIGCKS
ncbi:MAG: ribulose-phosphate 3-epimerase [Chloroflexi bacterium]|nr:ribulose-phosphate 3-epimerase [Chloroflexota bacterium]MCL5076021.1 ribulose-phosphate 3-epimerase [Chloroflexota bacterium]